MSTVCPTQLAELNKLIWGKNTVDAEIFKRWCQGFIFSSTEPTALIQCSGGPCAILASVQAVILRDLLFSKKKALSELNLEVDSTDLLISAIVDIMLLVKQNTQSQNWYWSYWTQPQPEELESPMNAEEFSRGLRIVEAESRDELYGIILSLAPALTTSPAILCFMYSVLLTHGLNSLRDGMKDEADPLIDPVHGHASQCLINLLISGQSTPYLFDSERTVSGITMTGILQQPSTGFLTVFEALQYCESGWYLKNPLYPVWILGSETHFTVLASPEILLVTKDHGACLDGSATIHQAELEFAKLSTDQETNSSIITTSKLAELLQLLKIRFTDQSLEELVRKLDPEDLGIILQQEFLQHFFPTEMANRRNTVQSFRLMHYNGLENSNVNGNVKYQLGEASILDPTEELLEAGPVDQSPIHRCIRTKWPTIRVTWEGARIPSLN